MGTMGRPKIDNPKSETIHVRLEKEQKVFLDSYCKKHNIPKTEAIRRGIEKLRENQK